MAMAARAKASAIREKAWNLKKIMSSILVGRVIRGAGIARVGLADFCPTGLRTPRL